MTKPSPGSSCGMTISRTCAAVIEALAGRIQNQLLDLGPDASKIQARGLEQKRHGLLLHPHLVFLESCLDPAVGIG